MEKPKTPEQIREKMIADLQWSVTYHTEKLAEAQMQLQIINSQYQPK